METWSGGRRPVLVVMDHHQQHWRRQACSGLPPCRLDDRALVDMIITNLGVLEVEHQGAAYRRMRPPRAARDIIAATRRILSNPIACGRNRSTCAKGRYTIAPAKARPKMDLFHRLAVLRIVRSYPGAAVAAGRGVRAGAVRHLVDGSAGEGFRVRAAWPLTSAPSCPATSKTRTVPDLDLRENLHLSPFPIADNPYCRPNPSLDGAQ